MKKFVINILKFLVGISFILLLYILSFQAGSLDFYYKRISSPKQNSLILGNSRSAQGVVPEVVNEFLFPDHKSSIYNFSFAANYSPYGEVYFEAVRKKIDSGSKNGIFIITVDPGSISNNSNPDDTTLMVDKASFLAHLNCVTCNPNFKYM